jgi:hypothetical protein
MLRCTAAVLISVLFGWIPGNAKTLPEGAARFGMSLWANPRADSAGIWSVAIEAVSLECKANAVGLAQIEVETGARVVFGDTERRIHPSPGWKPRDSEWQVALQKSGTGPVLIRGTLRIPGPNADSYTYVEQVLRLELHGVEVITLENRSLVELAVRNGQAFRYGGEYPVAVDPGDSQSPASFDSRPELVGGESIECKACGLSEAVVVEVVVTVGKSGTVTWIRPTPISGVVSSQVWNAVQNGLHHYRFRPAYSQGRPVADVSVLQVRVVPAN